MHVQRSSFLLLAGAIASATIVAPGCNSAADDADSNDSHLETPGAATNGACIATPGAGEKSRPANFAEGFCFDLARSENALEARGSVQPSSEGMGTSFNEGVGASFDDFIFEQCNMYRSVYRAGMGADLTKCLDKVNQARMTNGVPTKPVDTLAVYACGRDLFNVCDSDEAIDGRLKPNGKSSCQPIVDAIGQKQINAGDGTTPIAFDVRVCERALSGLRSTGRAQIKTCVADWKKSTAKFKLDAKDVFYSCMEGLQADFSFVSGDEGSDAPEKLCGPTEEAIFTGNECKEIAARSKIGIGDFLEKKCTEYMMEYQPFAGFRAIQCLTASKDVDRDIYACGTKGLKAMCAGGSNPMEVKLVESACKDYVDTLTSLDPKANAGGRATRECRALLPGTGGDEKHAKIIDCAKKRAGEFKAQGAARFAFFSCVESGGE